MLPLAATSSSAASSTSSKRNSKDLALLDKLVTTLLEKSSPETSSPSASRTGTLQRLRPLSRSLSRSLRLGSFKRNNNSTLPTIAESGGSGRRSDQTSPSVKNVINSIRNAPQRFSTANDDEESRNLTQNILE